MGFNISPLTFNYKKYVSPITTQVIVYDYSNESGISINVHDIEVISVPSWLEVFNIYHDEENEKITFSVRLIEAYVLGMLPDNWVDDLRVKFKFLIPWPTEIHTHTSDPLPLFLNLEDTVLLTLTPQNLAFEYVVGGDLPQNLLFNIASEANWNITPGQDWLTLSQTSGYQNASIIVGVDPSTLPVGNYEAVISVQDAFFTQQATVTLVVSEGDTATNFLYLNPQNFSFVSEVGEENLTELPLVLDASHSWTATPSQPWINISAATGDAGVNDLTISVDSEALEIGDFNGSINFVSNGITKTIYIALRVLEFLVDGIESNTLYYEDDVNKLRVNSVAQNSFLTVDVVAAIGTDNIIYKQNAPYFKGIAELIIGQETPKVLKPKPPTTNFTSRVQRGVFPINLNLTCFNINKFTEQVSPLTSFQDVKFLNGKTPKVTAFPEDFQQDVQKSALLSYMPSSVFVSKDAILNFSVQALANSDIVITGAVNTIISSSIQTETFVFNPIINLSAFALVPGDKLQIKYSGFTVDVTIVETPIEQRIIAFENEWNEYEFFEMRGFVTETPDAKKTTTKLQVDNEEHTKVVSIENNKSYTFNTGWIYTQEEVEWLTRILEAKHIYILDATEHIEVELVTKSMELYKTRKNLKSFNLKFKKAVV